MVAGFFPAARGPKSARFSSECPFFGPRRAQYGAKNQNCRQEEVRYHESNLGTAAGGSRDQIWLPGALRIPPTPPKGVFWAKTSPFGATGGQEEVHYQVKVCGNHESSPGTAACGCWDQIRTLRALRGPPGPPKGAFWAKTGPFGAPRGPEEAQYQVIVCGYHDSNPVGPAHGSLVQIRPLGLPKDLRGPPKDLFRPKQAFWGAPGVP